MYLDRMEATKRVCSISSEHQMVKIASITQAWTCFHLCIAVINIYVFAVD